MCLLPHLEEGYNNRSFTLGGHCTVKEMSTREGLRWCQVCSKHAVKTTLVVLLPSSLFLLETASCRGLSHCCPFMPCRPWKRPTVLPSAFLTQAAPALLGQRD